MPNLIETLLDYSNHSNSTHQYGIIHSARFLKYNYNDSHLKKFLLATNDEVRLFHASEYSKQILHTFDMKEADFFRLGVLRKEITANISYDKQRDHSAHTLYNYLLGCYLYENSSYVSNAFKASSGLPTCNFVLFTNLWPLTSILHDIGYLFEGSLFPLSSSIQSDQVRIGSDVINDFYTQYFWSNCNIYSLENQKKLLELAEIDTPYIDKFSLSSVANSLKTLQNPNGLSKALKKEHININLSSNAFELWCQYFEYYNKPTMVDRIKKLQVFYESQIYYGMSNLGLRILDHGVNSGLLLLNYNTFYYTLYHSLQMKYSKMNIKDKKICDLFFTDAGGMNMPEYLAKGWWEDWVRVTAATALHNFLQSKEDISKYCLAKLSIDEDPFTYIGILVDIIEEWDRFNSTPISIITKRLPIQGVDVQIKKLRNSIIEIKYPQKNIAEDVEKELNESLLGWDQIITISSLN